MSDGWNTSGSGGSSGDSYREEEVESWGDAIFRVREVVSEGDMKLALTITDPGPEPMKVWIRELRIDLADAGLKRVRDPSHPRRLLWGNGQGHVSRISVLEAEHLVDGTPAMQVTVSPYELVVSLS